MSVGGDARQIDVAADALVRDRVAHLDVDGRLDASSRLSSTASVASGVGGRVRVAGAGRDPLSGQRVLQIGQHARALRIAPPLDAELQHHPRSVAATARVGGGRRGERDE